MAKLNLDNFSEEYRDKAPLEASQYLYQCLSEDVQMKLKDDWKSLGGAKTIPFWKYCLEHIDVEYKA